MLYRMGLILLYRFSFDHQKKKTNFETFLFSETHFIRTKNQRRFFFMKAVNFYIHIEHFISKENTVSVLYRKLINLIYYLQCK